MGLNLWRGRGLVSGEGGQKSRWRVESGEGGLGREGGREGGRENEREGRREGERNGGKEQERGRQEKVR